MTNQLVTERLYVEELSLNDAPFILHLLNTPGWIKFIGDRNVRTLSDAELYVQKTLDNPAIQYWIVKLMDSRIPVGAVSFIRRDYLEHHDIGYAFDPDFSKRGYAYEAVKAVLDRLYHHPDHSKILATVASDNLPSIRLLEKLGLKQEKEIQVESKSLLLFSLINSPAS